MNDCKCACPKLQTWLDEDRAAGILLSVSPIFADDLYLTNRRGADVSEAILSALCNVGDDLAPSIGDSLESASPLDISFYPTHPTVDRLYHWRRINGFSDETWTDDMARSVSFEDVGYCWGHNLNDTLVWGDDLFADGAAGPYTNAMLWAAFDPTDGNSPTPYVYDTFEWPHCAAQGYPLTLIGNATNAEASGPMSDRCAGRVLDFFSPSGPPASSWPSSTTRRSQRSARSGDAVASLDGPWRKTFRSLAARSSASSRASRRHAEKGTTTMRYFRSTSARGTRPPTRSGAAPVSYTHLTLPTKA